MKKSLILLAGLAVSLSAYAVPAKPGLRAITQPDGTTIMAELRGDEFCNYYVAEDGIPMKKDTNGYLRYVLADQEGNISLTADKSKVNKELVFEAFSKIAKAERLRANAVSPEEAVAANVSKVRAAANSSNPWSGLGLMGRQSFPSTGDVKSPVVLVSYKDVDFNVEEPLKFYDNMLNQPGFSEYGGVGSARDFFIENSCGQFTPHFDVYGPVKLSENRVFYGGATSTQNDIHPDSMVIHAIEALDKTVDFSQYDIDGDGYIDNVFIIYAGQGEASYGSEETVWPHSFTLHEGPVVDGVQLGRYACSNEWLDNRPDGIGTFVHEFSHVMGLPDLYATSYTDAVNLTPGAWSTMDQGPYNGDGCCPPYYSAYERNALGWIDLIEIDGPANIEIDTIKNNVAYVLPTKRLNEFFLFENRQKAGWDACAPGHGMLVWHIDYNSAIYNNNVVNNSSDHQYVDIIEANNKAATDNISIQSQYTYPRGAKRAILPTSKPNLQPWFGPVITTEITQIYETKGIISMLIDGGVSDLETPVATEATNLSATGFKANWQACEGAESYLLTVFEQKATESQSEFLPFGTSTDKVVVLPEGWTFSGTSNELYTGPAFCGESRPALRFKPGTTLTSPFYKGNVEKVSLFIRATNNIPAESMIDIQGRNSEDDIWETVATYEGLDEFQKTGRVLEFDLTVKPARQIQIVYYSTSSMVAIDDVKVTTGNTYKGILADYDRKKVTKTYKDITINGDVADLYTYYVEAVDSEKRNTIASNTITVDLSEFSGIDNVAVGSGATFTVNGLEAVYNGQAGASVEAVSVSGAVVATAVSDASGNAVLNLPAAGFYILRAPGATTKVVVK